MTQERSLSLPAADAAAISRGQNWRSVKDRIAGYLVAIGGLGVILAIVLIFFYLIYVVFPLFVPASMEHSATYPLPGGPQAETLLLDIDELNEVGVRYTGAGKLVFFDVDDGDVRQELSLPVGDGGATAIAQQSPSSGLVAVGRDDGRAIVVRHGFAIAYPDDVRAITPEVTWPAGENPLVVDAAGQPLERLAIRDGESRLLIAATTRDGRLAVAAFQKESNFLTGETTLEPEFTLSRALPIRPDRILIDPFQGRIFIGSRKGDLLHYQFMDDDLVEVERVRGAVGKAELTSLRYLTGGLSLLAGGSDGSVHQWMAVRDDRNEYNLRRVRGFHHQRGAIVDIDPESRRKGFVAVGADGVVGIYNTTAERVLLVEPVDAGGLRMAAISPRNDRLLLETPDGRIHSWLVHNEHPEVSWDSLWGEVHYEGHDEPKYMWQSSSASNDFEPKFSLAPLAFGTLKAAFYAMLLAMPLAIAGAVYTAYFMAPRMRQVVKPTIEIMEALPTVILGFLAGLWLAPMIEANLPGIFSALMIIPGAVLLFAYLWHRLPHPLRHRIPEGWEAALLFPVVIFAGWFAMELSAPLERLLFDGNMPAWLQSELGIGFDQRNSIVVGLAMGFAVIPTIFSITEDAIFSVPRHLTFGSLALGATPWQTLVRVVLLTASPGIFSAVMIGMGRAVGETMIVLMATGNTPVMDLSIFQGMRTLSANIAVEMPESEVDSTHYRVLFLAALVLFLFTFVVNTLAEIVRQRLRRRYSSL